MSSLSRGRSFCQLQDPSGGGGGGGDDTDEKDAQRAQKTQDLSRIVQETHALRADYMATVRGVRAEMSPGKERAEFEGDLCFFLVHVLPTTIGHANMYAHLDVSGNEMHDKQLQDAVYKLPVLAQSHAWELVRTYVCNVAAHVRARNA